MAMPLGGWGASMRPQPLGKAPTPFVLGTKKPLHNLCSGLKILILLCNTSNPTQCLRLVLSTNIVDTRTVHDGFVGAVLNRTTLPSILTIVTRLFLLCSQDDRKSQGRNAVQNRIYG